ncbi:hypothetical protein N9Y61_04610 [Paracoccaceae bacterium]|jgi:hypothetical protein|nr:hypothetical protein [Paracoccaceae bacterium]
MKMISIQITLFLLLITTGANAMNYRTDPFTSNAHLIAVETSKQLINDHLQVIQRGSSEEIDELIQGVEVHWERISYSAFQNNASSIAHSEKLIEAMKQADEEALPDLAKELLYTLSTANFTEVDLDVRAASLSLILVSEDGLSEFYEEAVEGEEIFFELAKETLKTVESSIEQISEDKDVLAALAGLQDLFPGKSEKSRLDLDPEAAEGAGHELIAALEKGLSLDLYFSRSFNVGIERFHDLVITACDIVDDNHLKESISVANFYFENEIEATLSVLLPDENEDVSEIFDLNKTNQSDICPELNYTLQTVQDKLFAG